MARPGNRRHHGLHGSCSVNPVSVHSRVLWACVKAALGNTHCVSVKGLSLLFMSPRLQLAVQHMVSEPAAGPARVTAQAAPDLLLKLCDCGPGRPLALQGFLGLQHPACHRRLHIHVEQIRVCQGARLLRGLLHALLCPVQGSLSRLYLL